MTLDLVILSIVLTPIMNYISQYVFIFFFHDYLTANNINITNEIKNNTFICEFIDRKLKRDLLPTYSFSLMNINFKPFIRFYLKNESHDLQVENLFKNYSLFKMMDEEILRKCCTVPRNLHIPLSSIKQSINNTYLNVDF